MRLPLALVAAFCCSLSPASAGDDFASWHSIAVKALDTQGVDLISVAEVRFYDDSSFLRQYRLTQMVVVDPLAYLRLGVNFTYLPTRLTETDGFLDQHRLELEAIPRWAVTDRLRLDFRNRLELRLIEGRSGLNERSRHRLGVTYALKGLGPLTAVYASNEFFLSYSKLEYNQNRLVPLGLKFRIGVHAELGVDYTLQSVRTADDWAHAHVLGTHLTLAF